MFKAFHIQNETSTSPVFLIADHASNAIPEDYGTLGIEDPVALRRHVAWDIGIEDVTRRLADHLQATAIYSTFSRLLIDANRYPDDPASTPVISDGVSVPANVDMTKAERKKRVDTYFTPYHDQVSRLLAEKRAQHALPLVFSMHSFTPVMNDFERPWHVGVLWDQDDRIAAPLLEILGKNPALVVGDNEPYSAREPLGYTMNVHGTELKVPHVVIEIRQDLIDTHHGAEQWAGLMADAIRQVQKRLEGAA
ncbi:N-formylglutamate amidohydrolase [Sneathiella chinensis]|uniref:N-formylglutamate amidohydrolase n=1 Tax=Sneathiella chinensis TaxID=349750 RepID=A0ABQ5U528_9PROT|nr:N-formylglutamate amidohydrolase [Sneathiella chinensis]GLQ06501.1 N-formylglutamate amidohydrolase [Sneathiella chinensis]